jgi:hypothetical protein
MLAAMRRILAVSLLLLSACGARVQDPTPTPTPPSETENAATPPSDEPAAPAHSSSAATVTMTTEGNLSVSSSDGTFEISLAILPRTFSKGGLYSYEGDGYPKTAAEREAVFDSVAYTFPQLAKECAALHPGIASPPTEKDIDAIANCSYSDFGIKPYWIPQLVGDVDGCARKLGAGWRLPTENDVKLLSPAERTAIADSSSEGLYNGTLVFVRASDGSLALADLFGGVLVPFVDTSGAGYDPTRHYEGGASLRCVRGLD